MNQFLSYLITNYITLCIAIVLGITLIGKLKTQKRVSIYLLIILGVTVLITILDTFKLFAQNDLKDPTLTMVFSAILYVLRPACILLFIFLSGQKFKGISFYLLLVPILYCLIVNILPFIDATKHAVFYYDFGADGAVCFNGGNYWFLRYAPHIVSVIYLIFLVYKSVGLLRRKHISDALGIIICVVVVALATAFETFLNDNGDVYLLPTSIAIGTVFFYLFLYERSNKIDVLTGLFNRASYFDDISKLSKDITGIIQLDMNGLKHLNDNYGHEEGDKGLKRIARAIENNGSKKMYSYRLGGDEFVVLAINEKEDKVLKFVDDFKNELDTTNYYCSIGYAYRDKKNQTLDDLFKLSEKRMYGDKSEFYKKNTLFDRRKTNRFEKKH